MSEEYINEKEIIEEEFSEEELEELEPEMQGFMQGWKEAGRSKKREEVDDFDEE